MKRLSLSRALVSERVPRRRAARASADCPNQNATVSGSTTNPAIASVSVTVSSNSAPSAPVSGSNRTAPMATTGQPGVRPRVSMSIMTCLLVMSSAFAYIDAHTLVYSHAGKLPVVVLHYGGLVRAGLDQVPCALLDDRLTPLRAVRHSSTCGDTAVGGAHALGAQGVQPLLVQVRLERRLDGFHVLLNRA